MITLFKPNQSKKKINKKEKQWMIRNMLDIAVDCQLIHIYTHKMTVIYS